MHGTHSAAQHSTAQHSTHCAPGRRRRGRGWRWARAAQLGAPRAGSAARRIQLALHSTRCSNAATAFGMQPHLGGGGEGEGGGGLGLGGGGDGDGGGGLGLHSRWADEQAGIGLVIQTRTAGESSNAIIVQPTSRHSAAQRSMRCTPGRRRRGRRWLRGRRGAVHQKKGR